MANMQIISCIRFCIQLLITESIYTFAFERRKHFAIKAVAAICFKDKVEEILFAGI